MADSGVLADIRAAGGVVWRPNGDRVQVAIIHRPRYDDWSLPKGKLDDGETELAAAVREVREETGADVVPSRRLGTVRYDIADGHKAVTYWAMRHVEGAFTPTAEVDALEWHAPEAASNRLTYGFDRRMLADFAAVPVPDSVVLLVRHAKAGKRSEWRGTDKDRPLEPAGEAQAARLTTLLAHFAPDRIVSAEPLRCVETMRPLAERLGIPMRIDPVFGDEAFGTAPEESEDALMSLAKPGHVTVVCSQGDTIPHLVERLGGVSDGRTKKAAFWALSVVDSTVVSADHYDDAVVG